MSRIFGKIAQIGYVVRDIDASMVGVNIGVAAPMSYFTFGGNEYLVAAHATEAGLSPGDAVVQLHAAHFVGLSMSGGVVHVA